MALQDKQLLLHFRSFYRNGPSIVRVIALVHEAYNNESRLARLKQSIRWALASILHITAIESWFQSIDSSLAGHIAVNPRVGLKPFRVYQCTQWNAHQRMKVILETYLWASGPGHWFNEALLSQSPVLLASIPVKNIGEMELRAGRDNRFRKEGEVTLFLYVQGVSDFVTALAFSVEKMPDGAWGLRIGCVQGGPQATRPIIRDLTKALHGMRPKHLLVAIAQEIAARTKINHVLGVGGRVQAHRKKRAVYVPFLHRLDLDYDQLWIDAGGQPESNGWFRLPLEYKRKSREEIKPNKRGTYLRRYRGLDDIKAQLDARLMDLSHVLAIESEANFNK